MTAINRVCVIGAGVMGASIAAHVANAGHEVFLYDTVPTNAFDRNITAKTAIQKLLKSNPCSLIHPRNAKLIIPLNVEDHMERLAECDWIIEAVVERLDIKQSIYNNIEAHRKVNSIISSNTSTIPLAALLEGMSNTFCQDFCVTHFFNPPRYMRLLEIVKGPDTLPGVIEKVTEFSDLKLGKSIINCKDSPGFIANRLGIYWIYCALIEAIDSKIAIEKADAVLSKPCGVPKTGVFGLMDLVGLDLMPNILKSMVSLLPKNDSFVQIIRELPILEKMISEGYTGRKGKGGFYRINKDSDTKIKEVIDLATGEYSPVVDVQLASSRISVNNFYQLFENNDKGGIYCQKVMLKTLAYAATLIPDAAEDIVSIDEAMRLGYNWKFGPFELIDKVGCNWLISKLHEHKIPVPALLSMSKDSTFYKEENHQLYYLVSQGKYKQFKRSKGMLMLSDVKRHQKPILKNSSASLWDIGDGVVCFEFTSKMNSLDAQTMDLLEQSIGEVEKHFKALVIYNDSNNFSAGANLGLAMFAINIAAWSEIAKLVVRGQQAYKKLKYSPFPVVAAPSGMALGGGCELLLHCDAVQAHIETYTGLVEVGVGLVPGWGGCKEMLDRWSTDSKCPNGPMPAASKAFELISTATVSKSAEQARSNKVLRDSDTITMNRYRLLTDAKNKALSLVDHYKPPKEPVFKLPGISGKTAFTMVIDGFVKNGKATKHDRVVSMAVAEILSGGTKADPLIEQSEDDILQLERSTFMKIIRHPDSIDRIEHILLTSKPLRN